jgi:isopentenyl-diphosphate delta-isomerase
MELIDILTADGAPAGIVKEKRLAHRDGDWHRAAHLWILATDGRLLLQRRALVKESWPGLWDISVAGHVSAGESAIEAVIREAQEELGLIVRADELIPLGRLKYEAVVREDYIEREFHDVFVIVRDLDLSTLRLDEAEVAEVKFVTEEELNFHERVPHPAEYALLSSFRATLSRTKT